MAEEIKNGEIIAITSEGKEIVDRTDDLISMAERRIEKIQKIKLLALKSTNTDDWVDQQGKPYLTSSGAEKVARLFGVKIKNVKTEKITTEDEKGRFYYYLVTGIAELPGGDYIEAVGTCSSKDQFFAKKDGVLKPLSEVDETNILKSAYSNFIGNAITRLLGIRNLTWEELEQVGINRNKVAKVEYRESKPQVNEEEKRKQKIIKDIIYKLSDGDKEKEELILATLTSFVTKEGKEIKGVKNVEQLVGKRLDIAYGRVKQEYKNTFGEDYKENSEVVKND